RSFGRTSPFRAFASFAFSRSQSIPVGPRSSDRAFGRWDLKRNKNGAVLHADRKQAQVPAIIREGLARQQIELPAVPRTRQDLPFTSPAELARRRRQRRPA